MKKWKKALLYVLTVLLVMTANLIFYPVFEQYFPEEDA